MKDYFLGYEHGYKAGLKLGFIVVGVVLATVAVAAVHTHFTNPTLNCPSRLVHLNEQGVPTTCVPIDTD